MLLIGADIFKDDGQLQVVALILTILREFPLYARALEFCPCRDNSYSFLATNISGHGNVNGSFQRSLTT